MEFLKYSLIFSKFYIYINNNIDMKNLIFNDLISYWEISNSFF